MGKSPINQHNFHVIPISFPYLPTNKRQFASKKIVCIKEIMFCVIIIKEMRVGNGRGREMVSRISNLVPGSPPSTISLDFQFELPHTALQMKPPWTDLLFSPCLTHLLGLKEGHLTY